MLTVLVSTISNSQVFLLKTWVAFANAKATHIFFSKNISVYAIFNDQSFNDTLTDDIVCFEQLGPNFFLFVCYFYLQFVLYTSILTLFLLNQDMPCLCKQCRSRSVRFWRIDWSRSALFAIQYLDCINNLDQVICKLIGPKSCVRESTWRKCKW